MVEPDHVDDVISAWRIQLPEVAGLPLELAKRSALLTSAFDSLAAIELEKLGLTPAEYGVLATLRRIGTPYRARPSELTHALLLSSGGISNVLKRLVSVGYVVREAAEDDGRSTLVRLTHPGVQAAEVAVRTTTAAHARMIERIPEPTARALSELLRTALSAIEDGFLIRR